MKASARIAPPNSLALVADVGGGEIPTSIAGSLIVATSSCLAVGCRSETDGETLFTLGPAHEVNPGYPPAFEGNLATPSRKIAVQTVTGETILELQVRDRVTSIRVWVNDAREPDVVTIGTT